MKDIIHESCFVYMPFSDIAMPIPNRKDMICTSDVNLPKPLKYPGKFNRNNKSGTLKAKPEWIRDEVVKLVNHMKSNRHL